MPIPEISVEMELGEPSTEVLEYARKHCGEDPNTRLQAIYELREMIYERGECTPHRMDDQFLLRFLRARNFIIPKAHRLIANYYRFREENAELVENIYPFDLKHIGAANILAVPPYQDQNGRRLMILRIGCWDPKVVPVEDLFKGTVLAIELGLLEQKNQVLGCVGLIDLENIGAQHAWQITPAVAAKLVRILVTSFPLVTRALHIVNHSWLFDKIYKIFKPLLSADIRTRIYFHGHDFKSLQKHINPENLPERYGGIWPDYPYEMWLESLQKNYQVAKEVLAIGYKLREEELDPEVVRQLRINGVDLQ